MLTKLKGPCHLDVLHHLDVLCHLARWGYNTNAYKKPEPIRYISSELLLSTTVGDTHTIIQNH